MFTEFEFKNFSPSEGLKIYGNTMLHQLAEDLPHPFTATARLTKTTQGRREVYTCHLEVFSEEGLFLQESSSTDALAAIDGVENKLKQQISSWLLRRGTIGSKVFWKLKRFARSEFIGVPA